MLRFIILFMCFLFTKNALADDFTLQSKALARGVPMPVMYTCDGKDISPDLSWGNIPQGTQSLAIILSDPDAPGGTFYHWAVYNLSTNMTELTEGVKTLSDGAEQGKNSWGRSQYNGPCPPKGSSHKYIFTLYALDKKLTVPSDVDAVGLIKNMQGHILGQTEFKTVYTRWAK